MSSTASPMAATPAAARKQVLRRTFFLKLRWRIALWLDAIREGYVTLMPLTALGAIALTVAQTPALFEWMSRGSNNPWSILAAQVYSASFGVMGVASATAIAYQLSKALRGTQSTRNFSAYAVATTAGATFLMVVVSGKMPDFRSLGYVSALQGVIVGIASAELFSAFSKLRQRSDTKLGMLERGTSLGAALQMSLTTAMVLFTVVAVHRLAQLTLGSWVGAWPELFAHWLADQALRPELLNALLVLMNQLLWSVGVNGGQFLLHGGMSALGLIAPASTLYSDSAASLMFVNAFAHLGGAGATWGLLLFCIFKGRDPALKKLAWYSLIPALLNLNDLFLFGIPLIFSRAMFVPFLLAPLASCAIASAGIHGFGVSLQGGEVVWSTPVFLSGYVMSGSWQGVLLQGLGLLASVLIYAPFVRRLEQARAQRHQAVLKSALDVLARTDGAPHDQALTRTDAVGDVARSLLQDFRDDWKSSRVTLAYQPQHDAAGRVNGAEALLRWTHELHGPIPTQALINIAEECELIHEIGEWVLNQACADMAAWQSLGLRRFKVSINMSPLQLESPTWMQQVRQAIAKHGIRPEDLDIEITEGRSISNSEQSERNLFELQAMNISLSMDDFGMGCTSLIYMHRFDVHKIKLDGVLTRNVLTSKVDREIIRCVCNLGHSQGVGVVAEFVETSEQMALLQELGCDGFQGWFYSPAIAADDLLAYVAFSNGRKKA